MPWRSSCLLILVLMTSACVTQPPVPSVEQTVDPATIAATIAQLKDPSASVRYAAAQKIGTYGPAAAEAAPALVALFRDFEEVPVKPPGDTRKFHTQHDSPAYVASEACGKLGPAAIPALIRTFQFPNSSKWLAIPALYMLGTDGAKAIADGCRQGLIAGYDFSCVPRNCSADQIKAMREPLQKELLAMLADSDVRVRIRAAEAFAPVPCPDAVTPLLACLDDEDLDYPAAQALGHQGAPAVAPLRALLHDANPRKRQLAAYALGYLQPADAIPEFAAIVAGGTDAAPSALEALRRLEKPAVPALIEVLRQKDPRLQRRAAEILGEIDYANKLQDPAVIDALVARLDTPDPDVRRTVIYSLGMIGPDADAAAGKELLALLKNADLSLRYEAASALGKLRHKAAVEPLLQLLTAESPSGGERYHPDCAAAIYLGEIGDPRAFEPLRAGLQSPDSQFRRACAEGLGQLGDRRAAALLIPLLKEKDDELLRTVCRALSHLGDARAVTPMLDYLRSQRNTQGYINMGDYELRDMGRVATPILTQYLREEKDQFMRLYVLNNLMICYDPRAVRPLIALLDDPDTKVRRAVEDELARYAKLDFDDDIAEWKAWWKANAAKFPD